jgi:hypothetical protein
MFALAIYVLSVADFYHSDDALFIPDGVYDAIPPLPQSIATLAGELFATFRARLTRERPDASENLPQVFFGNASEILLNRFLEKEAIYGHSF